MAWGTALLTVYLLGWLITSIIAVVAAEKVHGGREMQPAYRERLAVLTGLVWPVIVIGVIQLVVFAMLARSIGASSVREPEPPGRWRSPLRA